MFLNELEKEILREQVNVARNNYFEVREKFFDEFNTKINTMIKDNCYIDLENKKLQIEVEDKELYCNLYEELINTINELNICYCLGYSRTKSIYCEDVYNNYQKYYQKVRLLVKKLCKGENVALKDLEKYLKFVKNLREYLRKIDIHKIIYKEDIELDNEAFNELLKYNLSQDKIIETAIEQNWDYEQFMRLISIYSKYLELTKEAKFQLYREWEDTDKIDKAFKDYPLKVIKNNPLILDENLFDRNTLIAIKRRLYDEAKNSNNLDIEEKALAVIRIINKNLVK